MNTVLIFSLLIVGVFSQFPITGPSAFGGERGRPVIFSPRNLGGDSAYGRDSFKTPCTDICKAPNYCYHGICIHQGRNPVGEEVVIPAPDEKDIAIGEEVIIPPPDEKDNGIGEEVVIPAPDRKEIGEEVVIPRNFRGVSAFCGHSLKVYCPGCEPPNYCSCGVCIPVRHLVDKDIPAASKGVSAFDGESCAKCHYPNQCIDRRCVPRGVERHLVNKCSYGADCGRGHWICFEGKCIKLQPEEEKNFY
uniref:Uncharacterized protein n=1 Tax=Caenorhabditis japonica TaxID=281687 RepID=A0A8R1E5I3_CAEJA